MIWHGEPKFYTRLGVCDSLDNFTDVNVSGQNIRNNFHFYLLHCTIAMHYSLQNDHVAESAIPHSDWIWYPL